jgi:hypothetical protein
MVELGASMLTPFRSLATGVRLLRGHTWFLVTCVLIATIVVFSAGMVRDSVLERSTGLGVLVAAAVLLIECTLLLGVTVVGLHICDGEECRLSDLASLIHRSPTVFMTTLAVLLLALLTASPALSLLLAGVLLAPFAQVYAGLAVVAGVAAGVLLVVSAARYLFVVHVIADSSLGMFAALRASAVLTRDTRPQAALFLCLLLVLNLAGACLAGVGLLLTVPWSLLALTHAYRRLTGQRTIAHHEARGAVGGLSALPSPFVPGA